MKPPMDIRLIVIPYDSAHRGARMGAGPERLIADGIVARLVEREHRVTRSDVELAAGAWRAEIGGAFDIARALAREVRSARADGAFPLVLAGNCMSAVGVVAGLGGSTGVVWCDAHGDFNTPDTTVGGFLDGMALATVTGRCWPQLCAGIPGFTAVPDARVWLVGARDLDGLEAAALAQSTVHRIPATGVGADAAAQVTDALSEVDQLFIHLDLDVLDPADARANEYAAPAGVRLGALTAMLRALAQRAPVAALTLSAYDPAYDADGRTSRAAFSLVDAVL